MMMDEARKLAETAWCKSTTSHLVMIPELAEVFAIILATETVRVEHRLLTELAKVTT